MSLHQFSQQSTFAVDRQTLFAWHERPGALERLIPPWDPLQVICKDAHIQEGAQVDLLMKAGPFPIPWRARHTGFERNSYFQDVQERGPFRKFIHTHRFTAESADRSTLNDTIDYELPLGRIGDLFAGFIEKQLRQTFKYRHHILAEDLLAHQDELFWNPLQGELDLSTLEHIDVVIHLAGENIGSGRWSAEKKKRILDSRIVGTRLLAEKIAARGQKPQAFLSAYHPEKYKSLLRIHAYLSF